MEKHMNNEPNSFNIELPFPPSNNSYYKKSPRPKRNKVGGLYYPTYITNEGRAYRQAVIDFCRILKVPTFGKLRLWALIDMTPKDYKRRDTDNFTKPLFDALQKAGVCHNDEQFKKICLLMTLPDKKEGNILLTIKELTDELYIRCVC
jgi:crossover junction endodeoxyribonuclease RusA